MEFTEQWAGRKLRPSGEGCLSCSRYSSCSSAKSVRGRIGKRPLSDNAGTWCKLWEPVRHREAVIERRKLEAIGAFAPRTRKRIKKKRKKAKVGIKRIRPDVEKKKFVRLISGENLSQRRTRKAPRLSRVRGRKRT